MRGLMDTLHLPTLQQHIEDLPHMITDEAIWFFENFRGVAENSLFSVYDPVLREAVDKLFGGCLQALAHVDACNATPSGQSHVFSSPGDMPLTGKRQTAPLSDLCNAKAG